MLARRARGAGCCGFGKHRARVLAAADPAAPGHDVVPLAGVSGISPAMLSEIETGKKHGSMRTLLVLTRALGADMDGLVTWAA